MLVLILTNSPLCAVEQYTKAECDRLKQQKEQIHKRLNAGYGFAEGEQLVKQDRELFQKIASHCTSPDANVSLQAMPSQAKREPMQNVVTAYTVQPTPAASNPPPQPSASRYVENIRQQFNWVGMAIIGILAALSWLIWRKL
ncbi:hypothetical protein [Rheinheimera sp. SA_1]|uniref:hypothetical protein n=1 Tax=Rheinheimera sp. SA_1 TaxID=1827365 RepID=UPI0012FA2794|nr:hypothetical protein [Rheinheimera sp. SA_1]